MPQSTLSSSSALEPTQAQVRLDSLPASHGDNTAWLICADIDSHSAAAALPSTRRRWHYYEIQERRPRDLQLLGLVELVDLVGQRWVKVQKVPASAPSKALLSLDVSSH